MNSQATQLQHGVFMKIFDTGVLISGDSGVGKSELALALLDRGHQLIADDVVEFFNLDDEVIGRAPLKLKNFLEVRGLGVFNIKTIFGDCAILEQHHLSMIIHLQKVDIIPREVSLTPLYQTLYGKLISRVIVPFITARRFELFIETLVRNFQLQPQHSLSQSGIFS